MSDDARPVFSEDNLVLLRLRTDRLIGRRPHQAAFGVAHEEIASPCIPGYILAPARDGDVPPVTVAGAGSGNHDRIATVGKEVR